ncbi:MAG: winged helix-turn-helix domain-containing protein [Mogibacterium sp.]|nr:winged helix-turn-helix domain-containing protein [Mogibacterium sp.]
MRTQFISDNGKLISELYSFIAGSFSDVLQIPVSCGWLDAFSDVLNSPDLMFLDLDDRYPDIRDRVYDMRKAFPKAYVVVIADDDSFALDAFKIHIDGYLIKPLDRDMVEDELGNFVSVCNRTDRPDSSSELTGDEELTIRTGRNFECFAGGVPIRFKRNKTKALLRYLTENPDRMISNEELINHIWGKSSNSYKSYLRTLIAELMDLFDRYGCRESLVKQWGKIGFFADLSRINMEYGDYYRIERKRGTISNVYTDKHHAAGSEGI